MYGGSPWRGYLEVFNLYAVQEAASQFAVMTGLKRPPFGRDGYTNFLPPDTSYDLARATVHLEEDRASQTPADPRVQAAAMIFPAHAILAQTLAQIPPSARTLLVFAPYYVALQGAPGTQAATDLAECKRRIRALAAPPGVRFVDFMIPSAITTTATNYWDPRHYRVAIAERLAEDLAAIADGRPPQAGDAAE